MNPQIVIENFEGRNNRPENAEAYKQLGLYRNLSTVWLTPTRGTMATKLAFNWMNVMGGFNQGLAKICVVGYEVGEAYNAAIVQILANPALSKFQYLLTVEEDNSPPPDGLLKLYESIQNYDVVGGLYWTKGPGGVPMIWGDPTTDTFVPQVPILNTVQECNGLGQGFTLFKMEMFKNPGFEYGKWFKTIADASGAMTQDLYFFQNAKKLGYKFASDNRVKVGHYSIEEDIVY